MILKILIHRSISVVDKLKKQKRKIQFRPNVLQTQTAETGSHEATSDQHHRYVPLNCELSSHDSQIGKKPI